MVVTESELAQPPDAHNSNIKQKDTDGMQLSTIVLIVG
jgi:hypothetical protein